MKGKNKTTGFNSKLTTFFERLQTFSKEIESKKTNDNGSIVIEQGEAFLKELRYLINLVDEVRDQGSGVVKEKFHGMEDLIYIIYTILEIPLHGNRKYNFIKLINEIDEKFHPLENLLKGKALHLLILLKEKGPKSHRQMQEYGITHGAAYRSLNTLKSLGLIHSEYYFDKDNRKGFWVHGLKKYNKPEEYIESSIDHQNKYRKKGRIYQEPLKLRAKCRDCNLVRELEYGEPLSSVCPRCGGIVRRVK